MTKVRLISILLTIFVSKMAYVHHISKTPDRGLKIQGLRFFFLLIALMYTPGIVLAQLNVGVDDTINPGVPVTLTAIYGEVGIPVSMADDGVEGPFPIGFPFSFFGTIYTQFYIGANGWISFSPNPNASGTRQAFAVPSSADYNPKNCILCPFQDLDPSKAESPYIFYLTSGQAPERKLVVLWCQAPMFHCDTASVTFQIVLNETSNIIENHIYHKPACLSWYDNKATLGVQNINGYIGYAVPGRNATSWSAQEEAWRYIPTTIDSFAINTIPYNPIPMVPGDKISYAWYRGSEVIGNTQTIIVTPVETTRYHAIVTLCDNEEFIDTVTVFVIPFIPNAFSPNGDGVNDKFRIIGLPPENITWFNLQIYNRWGQIVFNTTDITEAWDGTLKGEICPVGVYIWVIYYEDKLKEKVTNKGMITLIR